MSITQSRTDWIRCTRQHPCPICGRPDWCGMSADGAVCRCMRISEGAIKSYPDGGFLHRLKDSDSWKSRQYVRTVHVPMPPMQSVDMGAIAAQCVRDMRPERMAWLCGHLGVNEDSMKAFRVGWHRSHEAYSFSMKDQDGKVVGIRLRLPNGSKFSVRGGHEGVFIPEDFKQCRGEVWHICEGASDALALYSVGLHNVIGRPSCSGGVGIICDMVREFRPGQCVIIADADAPGMAGAERLLHELMLICLDCRLIKPPNNTKDVRAWIIAGASADDIRTAASISPIRQYTFKGVIRDRYRN